MYQGLSVAIVIPAYNEADRILSTIDSMPDFVDGLIVVDDASTDATSTLVKGHQNPRLTLLHRRVNGGVGEAILTGYREVIRRRLDVAVVMAGDGQMDPEDLPALLAPLAAGQADYVKGNRFAHVDCWRVMPRVRLLGNVALSLLTRVAAGYPGIVDSQSGYTAATRALLSAVNFDQVYPRYGFPNDFLAHVHSAGGRIAQVPVRPVYAGESSGIRPWRSIGPLAYVIARSLAMRLWREHQPTRPASPPTSQTPASRDPDRRARLSNQSR